MSSSLRQRRGGPPVSPRASQDSALSSVEGARGLREELARSLIRDAQRADSLKDRTVVRPSEMRQRQKKKGDNDDDTEQEDCVVVEQDQARKNQMEPEASTSFDDDLDNLDNLFGEVSSDEEEEAAAADFLLRMDSMDDADEKIKYVFKKKRGGMWRRRKTWVWAFIVVLMGSFVAAGCVHISQLGWDTTVQIWRLFFFLATCPLCWIGGRLVTFLTIKMVERTATRRPSFLYVVYGVRRPLLWFAAAVLVLISWACWQYIDADGQDSTVLDIVDWITRILGCIAVFFFAQLLKRTLAKMMSTILTGQNQRERMEKALKQEKLLDALMAQRPFEPSDVAAWSLQRDGSDHVVDVDLSVSVSVGNGKGSGASMPGSPTNGAKRIAEKIASLAGRTKDDDDGNEDDDDGDDDDDARKKRASPLHRAQQLERLNRLERYLRKRNLHVTLRDQLNQVENVAVDANTYQRLGNFLFFHLTHDVDSKTVSMEDIRAYIPKEKDAAAAFQMLDNNGDGVVDCDDCVKALERVYWDRNNLACTLRDNRSITSVVDLLLGIIIHGIFIFVYLLILRQNADKLWVGFGTLVLGFSFVFSGTVSAVFENAVFIFGVHAYDVGDVLYIDGQQLTVDEINMNFTVCLSGWDQRVYYPNQAMLKAQFVNLSKSLNKWEVIYVYVDADTSPDILLKIQEECDRVRLEHKGEYGIGWRCRFAASEPPYKLGIEMVFEYSHNGTNFQRTAFARSYMYEALFRVLVSNGVSYTWPRTESGRHGQQDSSANGRGPASMAALNRNAPPFM